MTWLTKNLGWMIALLGLLIGGAVSYGRIAQISTDVHTKADREDVTREMDLLHSDLGRIEAKIDQLIIMQQK